MRTVPFTPKSREEQKEFSPEIGDLSKKDTHKWRYYDEEGHGPFRRFLRPDNPSVVYPTRRIVMFLFLGSCLSTVGVQLSADEYYEGPQQTFVQFNRENKTGFPVHIAFNNVGCSLTGHEHPILSNITGEIRPKKLTGIMGQSGSGKTTFAYSILGRGKRYCTDGAYGSVFLNGRKRDLEAFLDRVGFVPQDDVLYPDLTVEEALTFSASWRLPRDLLLEGKQRVVEDTLETLNLTRVRNQRIGDVKQRSISGGERKRTSIGMELVSEPAVLVMDEPTSGLDSSGTFKLMEMLKSVALRGVSVVTVIHQPSARVFNLLDDLILMQNGEAAFVGPREEVLPFLSDAGYEVPAAEGSSSNSVCSTPSAEFILDVLARLVYPVREPKIAKYSELCYTEIDLHSRLTLPPRFATREILNDLRNDGKCLSKEDNAVHPLLPVLFRHRSKVRNTWHKIEHAMDLQRQEEDIQRCLTFKAEAQYTTIKSMLDNRTAVSEFVKPWHAECEERVQQKNCTISVDERVVENFSSSSSPEEKSMVHLFLTWVGFPKCEEGDARMLCVLFYPRSTFPSYHQLPKPGLKRQVHLWFWQMMGLKWRRGLAADVGVIVSLALVVSFVRSFNGTWNRRAVSNLFLSISIGLLGMVGAVFHDDIAPVQRAASAGMLLGAHEFAVLAENIVWGWCVCHIYSLFYFIGLWVRTGMWIIEVPLSKVRNRSFFDFASWVRLQKYYEFAHMLHLNYLASSALGNAICVFANHDTSVSYVAAVALLISCHVFAFFTPNQHQVKQESTIFGCINIGPFVELLCSLSYVRYFLEAIFLWDPSPVDKNGRNYVLRYFGYVDSNKTHCATSLFSLWTIAQAIRFLVFGARNSNDFHSVHDTPLFAIFIFKVLSCHVVALLIMTLIQEQYFPWVASIQEKMKSVGEDEVDIVSMGTESKSGSHRDFHGFKQDS